MVITSSIWRARPPRSACARLQPLRPSRDTCFLTSSASRARRTANQPGRVSKSTKSWAACLINQTLNK
eukprot:6439288-Pyramimonas_sp.AAC.1